MSNNNAMPYPTKKLGEVTDVVMGQSPPSSSYNERGEGLPFFQGKAEFGEIYPTPVKYCSSPSRIAEANDVLMSVRAPVGNINIAKEKSCVGRGLGALRAKKNILNQMFLFYFMKKNENNWSRLSTGSTFSAIRGSSLKNFKIPLPPLEIQKQIVERLDKIAEAQKFNDGLIQKTDELFQSLLHKELNPAGKDWKIKKIKDIATIRNGGTPSTKNSKFWNGKNLWLTPKELSGFEDVEIFDTERKISEEGLSNSSATLLPTGTVLFTSRAPIGYVAIAGVPMSTNQGFKNFICDEKQLNNKFLYFFLRLKKGYLQSLGRGATFTEISKTIVEKVEISLPPIEVQKQIVAKLSAVQDYKKQLLGQKAKLKELFDSALAKSMTGEKKSKDARNFDKINL